MDRDEAKQAIKDAIDISDLVARYTTLIPAGKRMKGLSPFTQEKTPSFFVDQEKGIYYCFSSQKGGDIFSFVQEMEGVEFREALGILAERAGIDIARGGGTGEQNLPLYQKLESAAAEYRTLLANEDPAKTYLKSRGITEKSIEEWGIGWAPDAWNTICDRKNPDLDACVRAGLCARTEKGAYDRFRGRVQFPFHDERGRVIGFSGRALAKDTEPKYINSPESPLFKKSSFIYGLRKAGPNIRKHGAVILTEGPIDAILAHQANWPIAVAVSGTAVTEAHLQKLRRLSKNMMIAFDSDGAGTRATLRVIEMALEAGIEAKVVELPEGEDPADTIARDAEAFKAAVKGAMPVIAFLMRHIEKTYGGTDEDTIRGINESVLPVIAKIQDPIMEEYATRKIAEHRLVSEEAVKKSVKKLRESAPARKENPEPTRLKPVTARSRAGGKGMLDRCLVKIAMAELFLGEDLDENCKKRIDAIKEAREMPRIAENVTDIHYEEQFPKEETRMQKAREDLQDTLRKAELEIRRRAEVEKAKTGWGKDDLQKAGQVV